MTKSALPAALAAIENVRRFIRSSESKVSAVKHILGLSTSVAGAALDWARDVATFDEGKKYDYACTVVMLYGALERFIEDSADEFIAEIIKAAESYEDLPDRLRSSHFELTLAHLTRTRESRYEGRVNAQELAKAFSSCLSNSRPFEFIAESMLHHSANFRIQTIDEFFGRIDVLTVSRRAVESPPFQNYLATLGTRLPAGRPEAILDRINLLVSMRNEVAHGDITNILAPSEIVPYCDQLEAYCRGITEVLDGALVAYLAGRRGIDHGSPIAVYNHSIVCINSRGACIRVGDDLAVKRADQSWFRAKVETIEIDNVRVGQTPDGVDVAVGIAIDGRLNINCRVKSGVFVSPGGRD